jgi:hypothetical protein
MFMHYTRNDSQKTDLFLPLSFPVLEAAHVIPLTVKWASKNNALSWDFNSSKNNVTLL